MQRLDHSMIYVLIAGTYTPVCLLALEGSMRWVLLAIVWTGAILGMAITLFALDRFPKISWALYLVLGWAALLAIPQLLDRPGLLGLAIAGGFSTRSARSCSRSTGRVGSPRGSGTTSTGTRSASPPGSCSSR